MSRSSSSSSLAPSFSAPQSKSQSPLASPHRSYPRPDLSSPSAAAASLSSTTTSSLPLTMSQLHSEKHPSLLWNRREKLIWFATLLVGTTSCYACRTSLPLVAPQAALDLGWSKTELGTVLSSFFWGYALTQILGGYLSDRVGAERVLLAAGLGWGLLTFWFPRMVNVYEDHQAALNFIVMARVATGAFQGVYFPALASISSQNLNTRDRSFFFSATTSGTALGTLLTGTLGSYMNENYRWPSVFYTLGFLSLVWASVLKYYAMELHRQRRQVLGMSSSVSLLGSSAAAADKERVPWLVYLKHPSLWACVICHFCQNNCFFILLSWLPTYFHDNFPEAQPWVFNVVPWLLMVPGIVLANVAVGKLLSKGYSVGQARKAAEVACMGTEMVCLVLIGLTSWFPLALFLCAFCLFAAAFHNVGCIVNPQDLAPRHTGSVFGLMNGAGAMPGFIGVYMAGYILDVTGSWAAVFNATAFINLVGVSVFVLFGSGKAIV